MLGKFLLKKRLLEAKTLFPTMFDACLWSWWSSGLENVFSWHSFHWKNLDLLPIDCVSTIWRIFYPQMQLQKVFLHTQVFVLLQAFYSQHVLLGHYPISALLNKPRNSWKKGFPPWKNEVEENIEEDKTKKRKIMGEFFGWPLVQNSMLWLVVGMIVLGLDTWWVADSST